MAKATTKDEIIKSKDKKPSTKASASIKKPTKKSASPATDGKKGSARDTILELTAESYACGNTSLLKERLTQGTGLALKTVMNNLAKLKKEDLVDYDATSVSLTAKGVEFMGDTAKQPKTKEEKQERIKATLKGKLLTLFELLQDGETHDKNEIAQELEFENKKQKGFQNLIGKFKGLGWAEYPTSDTVKLSAACFV